MRSVTIWSEVYKNLLQCHGEAFERLYPQGYPSFEDICNFETAVNDAVSGNQIPCSEKLQSISVRIDTLVNAREILKHSSQHCPMARQGDLPTVSQVYLELALYYPLLYDGPYKDATTCLAAIRETDQRVSSVERLFLVQDHLSSSKKDVPMIRNVRNALAHARLTLETTLETTNVVYCGTSESVDVIVRPLEDISLVGELLWRYTISVLEKLFTK